MVSYYVKVLPQILEYNKHVKLVADLFFAVQVPFFRHCLTISSSPPLAYPLQEELPDSQSKKNVKNIYHSRGFHIHNTLMYGELAPLKGELGCEGIQVNLTYSNKHVLKIERQIRVIKESVRANRHNMPFKVIPWIMLIDMIYSSTLWINGFPPKGGVSETYTPRNIMTNIQFDFNRNYHLPFRSYAQAHYEPSRKNIQAARTVGTICIGLTGKLKGSYKLLNLFTGKRTTRRKQTPLPIPQEVIDRVDQLIKAEYQPKLPTFFDGKGRLIGENKQADTYLQPGEYDT